MEHLKHRPSPALWSVMVCPRIEALSTDLGTLDITTVKSIVVNAVFSIPQRAATLNTVNTHVFPYKLSITTSSMSTWFFRVDFPMSVIFLKSASQFFYFGRRASLFTTLDSRVESSTLHSDKECIVSYHCSCE
jgi:hypothetical protein